MATREEILRFIIEATGEEDLDGLGKALSSLNREAKGGEADAAKLAKRLDELTATAKGAAEFVRLSAALDDTSAKLQEASDGLVALNREFDASDTSSTKVAAAYRKAESEIAKLTAQQIKQREALNATRTQLEGAGVDVNRLADEQRRLGEEAASASREILTQAGRLAYAREAAERNAKAFDAIGDSLGRLRNQLNDAGRNLLNIGAAAATAAAALATIKVGQFFTGGLQAAGELETALGKIQAAAGLTSDELQGVKRAIEDASANASKDVNETAAAFEALAREGLSAAEATEQLVPTLNFATAAMQSGTEAVSTLSGALDAFGLSANQTSATADLLAAAAIKGGTSIGDLAAAISRAGPTAAQLGLSIQDTAAAFAVLAQNGIEGGRAASAFATIVDGLADPTSALSRELAALGINSRDLQTVLGELSRRGTAAEAAFNALGIRGSTALRALAQGGGDALKQLRTELDNVEGSTEKAAEAINTDYLTALADAQNAFGQLQRSLAEPLLEPLADELRALSDQFREFAKTPEFAEIRTAVAGLFNEGLDALRAFVAELDLTDASAKIAAFATAARSDLRAFVEGLGGFIDTVRTFADTVSVIFNGIQTGIFGIVTALAKLTQFGAEVLAFQSVVYSSIPAVNELAKVLGVNFIQAAGNAAEQAARLQGVVDEFAGRTISNANETRDAIDRLGGAFPAAAEAAAPATQTIVEELNQVGEAANDASAAAADFESSFRGSMEGAADAAADFNTSFQGTQVSLDGLVEASARAAKALQAAIESGATQQEIDRLQAEFDEASAAVNQFEQSLTALQGTAETTGDALQRTSAGAQSAGDSMRDAADEGGLFRYQLRDLAAESDATAFSLGAVSEAAAKAFMALNSLSGQSANWAQRMNTLTQALREQREEAERRLQQLDRELAQYDPLVQKLEQLRSQYQLLDDATLLEIAQREERLAREQERVDRELERARKESSRAKQEAEAEPAGRRGQSSLSEPTARRTSAGGLTVTIPGPIMAGTPEQFAEIVGRAVLKKIKELERLSR